MNRIEQLTPGWLRRARDRDRRHTGAGTHKHKIQHDDGPYAMQGMCGCPGCSNAFAYYRETCACGAERTVCSGMGAASMATHRRHGYSIWQCEEGGNQ